MDAEGRPPADDLNPAPADDLTQRATARPWSFDFFQLLRRIEGRDPTRPRIGRSQRRSQDHAFFGQEPSLGFAPAAVSSFEPGVDQNLSRTQPSVTVRHFGLLGPHGPMPLHLTDYVRTRELHHDDTAWRDFLDMFHHRAISLFYAAWTSPRPAVWMDRPDDNAFARFVAALIGLPSLADGSRSGSRRGVADADSLPQIAKLHHAVSFARATVSQEAIESAVGGFFELPCEVIPFVGSWLVLPGESRCRLGMSRASGELGSGCLLGGRVWDCQHRFAIRLGPMGLDAFQRLLPGAEGFARLRELVGSLVGPSLAAEVRLVLNPQETPSTILGGSGVLGRTTWVSSEPAALEPEDVILRLSG